MSQQWQRKRMTALGVRVCTNKQCPHMKKKRRIWWLNEDAVALLIDGDHNSATSVDLFQSVAERLGPVPLQWVYGNWAAGYLKSWQKVLANHRLEARACGSVASGKNAADIALTRDMTLLFIEGVRKFVLVASDSDYTPLASWLCEQGCLVVVLGKATTPHALQEAASAFHLIDRLVLPERRVPRYTQPRATRSVVLPQAARITSSDATSGGETTLLQLGASPTQIRQWVLERLRAYETTPYGWVPVPSFREALRDEVQFKPKEYGYKHLFALLQTFPEAFELRLSPGQDMVHDVRRRVQE